MGNALLKKKPISLLPAPAVLPCNPTSRGRAPGQVGVVQGALSQLAVLRGASAGAGSLDFTQVLTFRNPHSALRTPHSAAALPPTNGREPLRHACSAATRGTSDVAATVRILDASARQSGVGKRREHGRFWLSRPPLRSQAALNAECGVRNAECEMQNPEIRSGGGRTWVKSRLPGPSHDGPNASRRRVVR